MPATSESCIELFSAQGKLVQVLSAPPGQLDLYWPCAEIPGGLYHFRIRNNQGILQHGKFVIQH